MDMSEQAPGNNNGQGGLGAAVHGVAKCQTRLSDCTEVNQAPALPVMAQ